MSLILSLNPGHGKKASDIDFKVFSVEERIKTGKIIELLRYRKTRGEQKRKECPLVLIRRKNRCSYIKVSLEEAKKINGFWDHEPQRDVFSTLIFASMGFLLFLRSWSFFKKKKILTVYLLLPPRLQFILI